MSRAGLASRLVHIFASCVAGLLLGMVAVLVVFVVALRTEIFEAVAAESKCKRGFMADVAGIGRSFDFGVFVFSRHLQGCFGLASGCWYQSHCVHSIPFTCSVMGVRSTRHFPAHCGQTTGEGRQVYPLYSSFSLGGWKLMLLGLRCCFLQ